MIPWNKRPPEVAILLNPAFCSLIIRAFCSGFKAVADSAPSIVLTPLVLPLVLHSPTRSAMPATTRTKFTVWVMENDAVRVNVGARIERLMPYTQEAMVFGIHHGVINIEHDLITPVALPNKKFSFPKGTDAADCINASERLGKLLAGVDSAKTIYSLLGIRP